MITARQAMEVLRNTVQEQAETNGREALVLGVDVETTAAAAGAYGAYQAMTNLIERMLAKGFSDLDPVAEADTALKIAQNCLRLNDIYQQFWDGLTTQFGEAVVQQLTQRDPMTFGLMLHWSCINAIVTEQTPEQHAHTEQMIANMKELLDTTQAQIIEAFRGKSPIQ